MEDFLRLPPQALEAECSIIGSMMIDHRVIDDVLALICSDDFYQQSNLVIFNCITDLHRIGSAVDVVTVSERLLQQGFDDHCYSIMSIGNIAKNTPNSGNVVSYAKIVKEKSNCRKLVELCNDTIQSVYESQGVKSESIIADADAGLNSILQESTSLGSKHISEYIQKATDDLESRLKNKSGMVGVPSGFKAIDDKLLGFEDGELYVVAARPAMGKTAFAVNMAQYAATNGDSKALFISLEMPIAQLINRLWSSLEVDHGNIRRGDISNEDWPKITQATSLLVNSGLYVDETSSLSVAKISAIVKKRIKQSGKMPVYIDYLQIMDSDEQSRGRYEDVTKFSNGLKALAKTAGVPIIVLSQLSRTLESRGDKRPIMSDLKESGAIEQDAGAVLFIYRDEVYNKNSDFKGSAEIIIGKNRHGESGTIPLIWEGRYQRFKEMNYQQMQDFNHRKNLEHSTKNNAKGGLK